MRARRRRNMPRWLLEHPRGASADDGQHGGPAEDIDVGEQGGLLLHEAVDEAERTGARAYRGSCVGACAARRSRLPHGRGRHDPHRGNVWLVQNPLPCLPCQLEGCERRLDSHSQCLDELSAGQVVSAVDEALAMRQAA